MKGGVSQDGDYAVIRIHMSDVCGLRAALSLCGCVASKSAATRAVADAVNRALGRLNYAPYTEKEKRS